MKMFNRIISLLIVALMLVASVPYNGLTAEAADDSESFIFTYDATLSDSFTVDNSDEVYFSFFSRTEYDGCYGNQLSGIAKDFYDAIVEHFVTKKRTGEYSHSFGNAFTFTAEISNGNIIVNAELAQIFLNLDYIVQVAMDAFLYDHPEIFWLRSFQATYSYSVSGTSGRITDLTVIPVEIYSGASSKTSEYESAVASAVSKIPKVVNNRYETLKNIHDYICENAYYNLAQNYRVHSSEAFFLGDGGVVCEGYAKAFKVLCDRFEIPCVLVGGDAGGAHMWNYVQMDDGNWYLVDATWDDQDSRIYYTYFIANANTVGFNDVAISEERTEHRDFSGTSYINFVYPVLSTTEYNIHTHEWERDFTVDLEPTCTEKGSKSIHCKYCEATSHVSEIDATNHPYKAEYGQQEPTCSQVGYTAGVYCPDCEQWLEGHAEISALGHIMGGWSENSAGKHIKHCTREGCDYTESEFCTYGNWIVTKEPTCKNKGEKSRLCTTCKHVITMAIDTLEHTPGDIVEENRTEPGCETAGRCERVIYCTVCDAELLRTRVSITALGHKWDEGTVSTASTCKANGVITYTCLNDPSHKRTESMSVNYGNHEGGTYIGGNVSATCFAEGYTGDTYCNGCGLIVEYGEKIPKLEHILGDYSYAYSGCHERECLRDGCWYTELLNCEYGDWVEVTAPTCTTVGELERTCKFCKEKDYAVSPSIAHTPGTPLTENLVEATCTKDGNYNERINCAVCGTLVKYTRNVIIPAFGHEWDEGVIKESTCNEVGYITYCCLNDERHTSTEYLSDFDYSNHVGIIYEASTVPPTCTSVGYNGNKVCSACERVVEYGEAIPMIAHSYETVVTPATLTVDGRIESKCSACDDVESTETIAKIKSVTLSATKYIHDGKNKTPKVTVKDADGKVLTKNVDYKTSVASKRSGIGRYTVKVTFIGNYSGSKNVYFTILPGKPASVKSASQTTSSVKLSWSAVSGAAGYKVYRYSPSKKAYVEAGTTEGTSLTVKKLYAGTKYTFRVVAYGKTSGGKVYDSESYALLKTATKTKTPELTKVTTSSKGKATLTWSAVDGETGYQVYYSTSKDSGFKKYANFAANSKSGTATGLTSGKTYYFKVRTYIKTDSGYVYSDWSNIKGVKVK